MLSTYNKIFIWESYFVVTSIDLDRSSTMFRIGQRRNTYFFLKKHDTLIHLAFSKGDWKHWPTTLNPSITLAIINVLTHQMQVYEASVIHASKHPSKQHPSNYPTRSLNCIFIETKWTNTHSYKRPPKLHPLHKSLNNCMTMNEISNGHWIPPVDQHWVTTLTPLFPTPKPPTPSIFPIPQDPPKTPATSKVKASGAM